MWVSPNLSWKIFVKPVNVFSKNWVSWYDHRCRISFFIKPLKESLKLPHTSTTKYLRSPRPPAIVTDTHANIAVLGYVAIRQPYHVKNFSRDPITPYWHARTRKETIIYNNSIKPTKLLKRCLLLQFFLHEESLRWVASRLLKSAVSLSLFKLGVDHPTLFHHWVEHLIVRFIYNTVHCHYF